MIAEFAPCPASMVSWVIVAQGWYTIIDTTLENQREATRWFEDALKATARVGMAASIYSSVSVCRRKCELSYPLISHDAQWEI